MSATKLENELHCPTCLYCLRGLTTNRCPECGANFDPVELRAVRRTSAVVVVSVAACLVVFAVAIARLLTHALSGYYLLEFVSLPVYDAIHPIIGWVGLALALGLGGLVIRAAWQRLRRVMRIRGRRGLPLLTRVILVGVLLAAIATVYVGIVRI